MSKVLWEWTLNVGPKAPRHISQTISPRTTIFYIWDHITLQSKRSHYTISHHHISKHNIYHITQPQSRTIPHPQLYHTTPTFNITAYFTPHHIPHRIIQPVTSWFYITPPHLTSQQIASFSTSDVTQQSQHIAYATFFITTIPHHHISYHVTSHILHYATFHIPGHHIPHHAIFHILHFNHTLSEMATFHIAPHFTCTHITSHFTSHHNSHQITPPHFGTPFHITPTFHLTPRHAHRHIQI